MQEGSVLDGFNPLDILAVAAGIQQRQASADNDEASILSPLPTVKMKLTYSDVLLCEKQSTNGVSDMFEEHNYGNCRRNLDYIIADEPFDGDQRCAKTFHNGHLDANSDALVNGGGLCDAVSSKIDQRHDSGYSDSGILDSSQFLNSFNTKETINCQLAMASHNATSLNGYSHSPALTPKSRSNNTFFTSTNDPVCDSCEDSVADRTPAADLQSVDKAISGTGAMDIAGCQTQNGETTWASGQTVIKSLLTGRTIVVVPKSVSETDNVKNDISSNLSPVCSESNSSVILSPDSAYNTDSSNMADDTFLLHSPDGLVPSQKSKCEDESSKRSNSDIVSITETLADGHSDSPVSVSVGKNVNHVMSHLLVNDFKTNYNGVKNSSNSSDLASHDLMSQECSKPSATASISRLSTKGQSNSVDALVGTASSARVRQFRIGSFASFSNTCITNASSELSDRNLSATASTLTGDLQTPTLSSSTSALSNKLSVSPSDILDVLVTADSAMDPISLDHDYCMKNVIPLSISDNPVPKLGRPPVKPVTKKKRSYMKRESARLSKHNSPSSPELEGTPDAVPSSPEPPLSCLKESVAEPCISPARRSCKKGELLHEDIEDQSAKVKITGNYQDQFVYYVGKTDRVTRRQRTKLPNVSVLPPPSAADIIIPRLSDADIIALKAGKTTLSGIRVPRAQPLSDKLSNGPTKLPSSDDDDSHMINTCLGIEEPSDNLSLVSDHLPCSTDDLSELTTEQMDMLFNAIDEIQSSTDPSSVASASDADCTHAQNGVKSPCKPKDANGNETLSDEKILSTELNCTDLSSSCSTVGSVSIQDSLESNCDEHKQSDSSQSSNPNVTDDQDNSPWIVIVTVYWNDLPAVMIDMQPYIRLIDIYKQILPAKDTGILKKRCQLMGMAVRNCTEMQRYFLVKYGHAHNSKSSLVTSKEDANRLIAFYVEPHLKAEKIAKSGSRCKKSDIGASKKSRFEFTSKRPSTLIQRDSGTIVTPVFTDITPNPPFSAPPEPLGRLRHKKINFRGMLRGNTSSDDESDGAESIDNVPVKRQRKATVKQPRRNTLNTPVIKAKSPDSRARTNSLTDLKPSSKKRVNSASKKAKNSKNVIVSAKDSVHSIPAECGTNLSTMSDQNTQTARLSDDVTDSESSPEKRLAIASHSEASDVESPVKRARENGRIDHRKRKMPQVHTKYSYSSDENGRDDQGSSQHKQTSIQSIDTNTATENFNNNCSSVITLTNGPAEYETFTALDDDFSY